MVLGINFASEFPVIGLYVSVLALIAITAGTLWQKKLVVVYPFLLVMAIKL